MDDSKSLELPEIITKLVGGSEESETDRVERSQTSTTKSSRVVANTAKANDPNDDSLFLTDNETTTSRPTADKATVETRAISPPLPVISYGANGLKKGIARLVPKNTATAANTATSTRPMPMNEFVVKDDLLKNGNKKYRHWDRYPDVPPGYILQNGDLISLTALDAEQRKYYAMVRLTEKDKRPRRSCAKY